MEMQIKMMASTQLGLNALMPLGRFEIEGWPRFVSFYRACWDDLALKDLQEALPFLSFTLKTAETSSGKKKHALALKQIELNELLLTKFKKDREDQHEKNYNYIYWHNFHVNGWPSGISIQRDKWTFPDLLAIYHSIDGISWEPVRKGEDRSVTYTDGTVELIPRKRAAVAAASDHEANDFESSERMQISDADADVDVEAVVEDQNNAIESDDESCSDVKVNGDITDVQIPKSLRIERKKMYKRIKALAMEQLGPIPGIELKEFDIEGWPRFVSIYSLTWDELVLKYLEDALPLMVFKRKPTNSLSETNKKAQVDIDRKDLSSLLLKKFNEGIRGHGGPSYKLIQWKSCHLKGWPQGSSLDSKYWTFSDLLAIYHNIDGITWEPVKDGDETRTVTYTDGTVEVFPFKRFIQHVNENESKKKGMKITNDQPAGIDYEEENQLAEEEEEPFSDEIAESDPERCKTKSEDLAIKCKQMHLRIKMLTKQQLGLTTFESVNLKNLDIEGWPRFVGFYSHTWDELALDYLEAALSAMIFKEIRPEHNTATGSEKKIRQLELDRSEIYSLLLKKFNEGLSHKCRKYIPWMTCHINGWPPGVGFMYKNWRIAEMLRVYHHLAGISWEPVQEGEQYRRITYTDGTIEYLPSKPARKPRSRMNISDQSDDETDQADNEIDQADNEIDQADDETQSDSGNEAISLDRLIESEAEELLLVEFGHVTRKRSRDHDPDDSESNKRLKITEDDRSEEADYKYDDIFEDEQQFFDDFFSFISE